MSSFDSQMLSNLKALCRIECTPEEERDILNSLSRVLEYVHLLDDIDTTDVPPCSYVLQGMLKTVWREDEPKDLLSRQQFLANAPEQIGGMIRVPPVLKDL